MYDENALDTEVRKPVRYGLFCLCISSFSDNLHSQLCLVAKGNHLVRLYRKQVYGYIILFSIFAVKTGAINMTDSFVHKTLDNNIV